MLDAIVVGAGIAGLTAAISLRRAGHRVRVYERSAMNNEVGAAINVPPNAARFLVRWGLDPVREGFVKAGPVHFCNPKTLAVTSTTSHADNAAKFGGAYLWYAHRVDLHNALKKLATGREGPGPPVTILLKSRVVAYVSGRERASLCVRPVLQPTADEDPRPQTPHRYTYLTARRFPPMW